MIEACIVQCAAATEAEADEIASALLSERLAACVQLTPIVSRYLWRGAIEAAPEVMLAIKTRSELFERVCARIRATHSYEVPEILAIPVLAADAGYLAWLADSTSEGE